MQQTSVPAPISDRLEAARRHAGPVPRWHNEWLTSTLLDEAVQNLSSRLQGDRILDIGCGNKPYSPCFPKASLYLGIDVVSTNSSADIVAHSEHLPFASGVFDGVLCTQVLEHVEHPGSLLGEAFRVLRPGGKLLLSAPFYWRHHEEPYDFFRYTRYGLRRLLEDAGFEVEQVTQQGGAWRVVGQSLANTLQASVRFRTFGLMATSLALINTVFSWLDRINYHEQDTCNFVVLASKV